jgi:ribosomal protein S18 acetylase RimI-like enzyme
VIGGSERLSGHSPETHPIEYGPAAGADIGTVKQLFLEYAGSLGFDLCFQGFERELASLPGEYSEPEGTLILAKRGGEACGCVGLRKLDGETCEMKRLYVRPGFRGLGTGRELVSRLLSAARTKGYRRMRLDTLPSMTAAIALYRSFGFYEIPPYVHNPVEGAICMEKVL